MIILVSAFLGSCNSKEEVTADELSIEFCECLKDAEAFTEKGVIELSDTTVAIEKSKLCIRAFAPVLKKGLSDAEDKQAYIKNAMKSLLKTDCGIDVFKLVPYENLKAEWAK